MSELACYTTHVEWKGEHTGHIKLGNGPELDFSAPPDSHGVPGLLTPEDAFVGAVNTCVMLMFLWACERLKVALLSYSCIAEGTKLIALDHTEIFSMIKLKPEIRVGMGMETSVHVEKRVHKALKSAQKYSLVANSIKSDLIIEPVIDIVA